MRNVLPTWRQKPPCHIKSENHNLDCRIFKIVVSCFRCMKEYTEDEQADLNEMFNGVAHTECFAVMFEEGCGAYMENTIDAMAGLGNYGSGSGSESGAGSDL